MGRGGAVAAWGRGYGDNAGGGMEINFRWVWMGVLNGFFFDFLGVSLHGGGGCVVAVVVWVWGFDLWEWVLGCGVAVAAWGRDCGWVLILLRAVVMETTPVEAWISASNGF